MHFFQILLIKKIFFIVFFLMSPYSEICHGQEYSDIDFHECMRIDCKFNTSHIAILDVSLRSSTRLERETLNLKAAGSSPAVG